MLDPIYNRDRCVLKLYGQEIHCDLPMKQLDYRVDKLVFEYFYDEMMDIDVHHIEYDLYKVHQHKDRISSEENLRKTINLK